MEGLQQRLERIHPDRCRTLLNEKQIGRIAVIDDKHPLIFPMNYVFSKDTVLFRTDEGSAIERVLPADVAFEIDGYDTTKRVGWSVLVKGRAHDVSTSLDAWSEALRELMLRPWAPGEKGVWVAIAADEITGLQLI